MAPTWLFFIKPPIALVNSNLLLGEKNASQSLFPKDPSFLNLDLLLEILDKGTKFCTDDDLEQLICPLLTLIVKAHFWNWTMRPSLNEKADLSMI
jgi:hypothetical protein